MQKKRSFHFEQIKDYFYENFNQVSRVEVSAEKESNHSFKAVVKVLVKGHWVVAKRKGQDLEALLGSLKRAMDGRLRRLRDKAKQNRKPKILAVNFI